MFTHFKSCVCYCKWSSPPTLRWIRSIQVFSECCLRTFWTLVHFHLLQTCFRFVIVKVFLLFCQCYIIIACRCHFKMSIDLKSLLCSWIFSSSACMHFNLESLFKEFISDCAKISLWQDALGNVLQVRSINVVLKFGESKLTTVFNLLSCDENKHIG